MSDQQIENEEPRIITDSEGLMAQFIEVPVERDIIPVYCALPQGQEKRRPRHRGKGGWKQS